jgi:hypothetical protein
MNKFLLLVGFVVVVYFGYSALDTNSSNATYDFYYRTEIDNCNSPYNTKPISFKFSHKKETNEIFRTSDFEGKKQIDKLDNCAILDSKNWTCGGERNSVFTNEKYTFINGLLSYENIVFDSGPSCPPKIVKR